MVLKFLHLAQGWAAAQTMMKVQKEMRNKKQCLDLLHSAGFFPDVIIDVGFAAGTDGLYETYKDAHYVLIEMLESFIPAMKSMSEKINSSEWHLCALGATRKNIEYFYDPTKPHCVTFNSHGPLGWQKSQILQATLDSIVLESPYTRNARKFLVKIDVDGPEIDVLKGAEELLKKEALFIIESPLCDSDKSRFLSICNFMSHHGYEIFDLIEPVFRPIDQALWLVDVVFVPRHHWLRKMRTYN